MCNLIIISGPSGAGKSSLCAEAYKVFPNLYFSISSTTRQKREGEVNGVHYHFITNEEFQKGIDNNEFLEWAMVHNNYYGTSRVPIEQALKNDKIVLFDIDIQGQRAIKKHYPNATSIFITTPNAKILESRLKSRALDSLEVIENRINHAYNEIKSVEDFDYLIINDDFNTSLNAFLSIIKSLEVKNSSLKSSEIIKSWSK